MIRNKHTLTRVAGRTGLEFHPEHHYCTSPDALQDRVEDELNRYGYRLIYRDLGHGPRPYLWPKNG